MIAELALWGRFELLPGDLYFRRVLSESVHDQLEEPSTRNEGPGPAQSTGMAEPVPVLLAEYVLAYAQAVLRAPTQRPRTDPRDGRDRALGGVTRCLVYGFRDPRAHKIEVASREPGSRGAGGS